MESAISIPSTVILVIDQSQATITLLKTFLKKIGYEKIHTSDSASGGIKKYKEIAQEGIVPIVLLDHDLDTTDKVSSSLFNINPDVKIILETANQKEGVKEAFKSGAFLYLKKPIQFDDLKEVMKKVEKEGNVFDKKASWFETQIENLLLLSPIITQAQLSEYAENFQVLPYLEELATKGKLVRINKIHEISCNQCGSVRIRNNFACPSCSSQNFKQGNLIEHYSCGNLSSEDSYNNDICPKCHKEIKMIGVDYKSIEKYYTCNDCGNKFPEPQVEYLCMKCNNLFYIDNARWVESQGFKSTKNLFR